MRQKLCKDCRAELEEIREDGILRCSDHCHHDEELDAEFWIRIFGAIAIIFVLGLATGFLIK